MIRAVVDTNVLISAIAAMRPSAPSAIYQAILNEQIQLVASAETIEELEEVLTRSEVMAFHKQSAERIAEIVDKLTIISDVVIELAALEVSSRDADDNVYLAVAIAGHADCIISEDKDLLTLKTFEGIPILKPADFVRLMLSNDES